MATANCIGRVNFTDCILQSDITANELGILEGDTLTTVIQKICDAISGGTVSTTETISVSTTNTDDISYSKSTGLITNNSRSALDIVTRDYVYSYNGSIFTYDLSNISNNLPSTHKILSTTISGSGGSTSGLIGGLPIDLSKVPAIVTISARVSSPDGDIDLKDTITINDIVTDTRAIIDVVDLTQPSSRISANLTDYLDALERQITDAKLQVSTVSSIDYITLINTLQGQVETLQAQVDSLLSTSTITYNDGTSNVTSTISDALTSVSGVANAAVTSANSATETATSAKSAVDALSNLTNT